LKRQDVTAKELLKLIPDEEFTKLLVDSEVDYQVKKLYGRNLFYILLYGLLESSRMSLRSLEDVYKSNKFKFLFNLNNQKNVKFNTISARLSNVNIEFFENVYELIYKIFSSRYSSQEALTYKITRVDSSMVCEIANKLEEGMIVGTKKENGKKQIKYTISLTDILPSSVEMFTGQTELSEDVTIPKVILKNLDKKQDNIFVFDRGVQSREQFCRMDENDFKFVTRVREVARHEILRSYIVPKDLRVGNLQVLSDDKVYLFGKHKKVEHPFRLIKSINERNEPLWFLTNDFSISIEEIIGIYKKRWDIEVFFRFIKQELNFKHFVSTSKNGIKVILYMTLILAMLILIYKKYNNVGYKTAKRRFYYEIDDMILLMVAKLSGGDPNLVFR
jgi:transposase